MTVDPTTTALVVQDLSETPCGPQANCRALLLPVASLLTSARDAGVLVLFTTPNTREAILPEVAPMDDETFFPGRGQDRFYNTPLDDILQAHGISTVILVGWRANGSILYTSFDAANRGYTVVVPIDGTSAGQDFEVAIGRYQMLNHASANATNQPLKPGAVTLSQTDLISFG